MTKKDLVQELRSVELSYGKVGCEVLLVWNGGKCDDFSSCRECSRAVFNVLADRIEAEYDPKPEPDTLEKVAKEMWLYLEYLYARNLEPSKVPVQTFSERLEDPWVTFDD